MFGRRLRSANGIEDRVPGAFDVRAPGLGRKLKGRKPDSGLLEEDFSSSMSTSRSDSGAAVTVNPEKTDDGDMDLVLAGKTDERVPANLKPPGLLVPLSTLEVEPNLKPEVLPGLGLLVLATPGLMLEAPNPPGVENRKRSEDVGVVLTAEVPKPNLNGRLDVVALAVSELLAGVAVTVGVKPVFVTVADHCRKLERLMKGKTSGLLREPDGRFLKPGNTEANCSLLFDVGETPITSSSGGSVTASSSGKASVAVSVGNVSVAASFSDESRTGVTKSSGREVGASRTLSEIAENRSSIDGVFVVVDVVGKMKKGTDSLSVVVSSVSVGNKRNGVLVDSVSEV